MIVVLSEDSRIQSRWQRFWKQSGLQETSALGESIMLIHPGQKPNWEKLARRLGRYTGRVVCGSGVQLPKERPWKAFDSSKLKEKLLCNTLCSFRDSLNWVGLYDPEGKRTVTAWELAQVFPRVTVWCRFRERYDSLCGSLMEQLGAAVELTSVNDGLLGCPLIGAMDVPPVYLRWDGTMLLCGRAELPPMSGVLRQDLRIPVPRELLAVCPADVDPMELYLALLHEGRRELPPDLCYDLLGQQESASEPFEMGFLRE